MRYTWIYKKFPLFYKLLDEAEKLFGKRDEIYELVDILYLEDELKDENGEIIAKPFILYLYPLSNKEAILYIYKNAKNDIERSYFQISRLIALLLSPIVSIEENRFLKEDVAILETGISTYFTYHSMRKWFPDYYSKLKSLDDKITRVYNHTSELVEKLLKLTDGIDEKGNVKEDNIIKKVREINPKISYLKPEDFYKINNNLSEEFFKKNGLMELFDKFEPLMEGIKEENKFDSFYVGPPGNKDSNDYKKIIKEIEEKKSKLNTHSLIEVLDFQVPYNLHPDLYSFYDIKLNEKYAKLLD